ncbi:MAG: hypothetical protein JO024_03510 [Candidatus Eremiobacteraeota bacterium]|nr:hypothetical protein [Candidatus Eremiobacteraeota bacterium]
MRLVSLVFITLAFFSGNTLAASANAFDDLNKMQAAMSKVHSYKSTVTWTINSKTTVTQVEVVNPNRFHTSGFGGALQFIGVGRIYWFHTAKQSWTKITNVPGMSMISTVTGVIQFNNPNKYNASHLGMRGGYRAVLVKDKEGKFQATLYLQRDNLLAAADIRGGRNNTGHITYGSYNAPLSIQPPTK